MIMEITVRIVPAAGDKLTLKLTLSLALLLLAKLTFLLLQREVVLSLGQLMHIFSILSSFCRRRV